MYKNHSPKRFLCHSLFCFCFEEKEMIMPRSGRISSQDFLHVEMKPEVSFRSTKSHGGLLDIVGRLDGHRWELFWGKKYLVVLFVVWNRNWTCPQILQAWQERFVSCRFLELLSGRVFCWQRGLLGGTLLHLLGYTIHYPGYQAPGTRQPAMSLGKTNQWWKVKTDG